jgi:hypothetical protein
MSVVYAESSAVLGWLLGSPHRGTISEVLAKAPSVTTSEITHVEVARTIARLEATKVLSGPAASAAREEFDMEQSDWHVSEIAKGTWARLAAPFPVEPVKTLDGVHLAAIEELRANLHVLTVLSLDDGVRRNARAMNMLVEPKLDRPSG